MGHLFGGLRTKCLESFVHLVLRPGKVCAASRPPQLLLGPQPMPCPHDPSAGPGRLASRPWG